MDGWMNMMQKTERFSYVYTLVPVFFALVQSRKDKRDECRSILTNQVDNPVIVPEVQRSLSNLPRNNSTSPYKTQTNTSTVVPPDYKVQATTLYR